MNSIPESQPADQPVDGQEAAEVESTEASSDVPVEDPALVSFRAAREARSSIFVRHDHY